MLPALFDEAVAPIGILGDHDERTVLEAALALEVSAEQVVVLVLGRHTHAFLRLDLRVEAARADAQVYRRTRLGEQLPRILRDEDPALADIFGAETVTVGATRNAHSVALFSHIAGPLCRPRRSGPRSAQAGGRIVQKAHQMHHRHVRAGLAEPGCDLEDAAWVGGDDEVGARLEDRRDLLPLELLGDLGMREVVDAGAPAAALRIGDRDDRDVRDRREEGPRLATDPLSVREVAGVLVDDPDRTWRAALDGDRIDGLRRVADAGAESSRPEGPRGIVGEQLRVGLELRAAAGRVHDDRRVGAGERVDVQDRKST